MIKKIHNTLELRQFAQKLKIASGTLPTLQNYAAERAADQTVLKKIHSDMKSADFNKKIIEHTYIGPIKILFGGKRIIIPIISDYVSDSGFDVSKGREEGTKDHDVYPVKKLFLRYIDPITRKYVFRKKTHPSGIKRLLIIKNNVEKDITETTEAYKKEISRTITQSMV